MKILYIEDDQVIGPMFQEELTLEGHDVVWVDKLSHATEELSNYEYDGVICDGTLDSNNYNDGVRYAVMLHKQGKKVVVFSMDTRAVPSEVPCVSKSEPGPLSLRIAKLIQALQS